MSHSPVPVSPPPESPSDSTTFGHRTPRASGATWAGGIALALVLYVLSIGPVFSHAQRSGNERLEEVAYAMYLPLLLGLGAVDWATGSNTAGDWVTRYLKLWGWEFRLYIF
jgi:hypothetical protein